MSRHADNSWLVVMEIKTVKLSFLPKAIVMDWQVWLIMGRMHFDEAYVARFVARLGLNE